ncbi:MAG TPA: 3-phosphoserine/phosphohydroxythreonine transaminase, partial [Thiomicrorhabdus sp.]|nr:3-phosphoserine/phosphohydroxythreonine transaminase [Thiomicrorhabdus sp.]
FLKSNTLDTKFLEESTKSGLLSLKGHKAFGGMRASIYNAMPEEGVDALIEFLTAFANQNK